MKIELACFFRGRAVHNQYIGPTRILAGENLIFSVFQSRNHNPVPVCHTKSSLYGWRRPLEIILGRLSEVCLTVCRCVWSSGRPKPWQSWSCVGNALVPSACNREIRRLTSQGRICGSPRTPRNAPQRLWCPQRRTGVWRNPTCHCK